MKRVTSRVLILFLLISIAGCGDENSKCTSPSRSEDIGYFLDSTCTAVTWASSEIPIRMTYLGNIPAEYRQAIEAAADVWEDAVGRSLFDFSFNDNGNNNTIEFVPADQWSFKPDQTATTQYQPDSKSHSMIYAKIHFNMNYTFSTTGEARSIDLMSVAIHELGHVLGLDHIEDDSDPESVMHTILSRGVIKRRLSNGDIQRIRQHY